MNGDTGKLPANAVCVHSSEAAVIGGGGGTIQTTTMPGPTVVVAPSNMQIQQNSQSNDFGTMNGADNDYYVANKALVTSVGGVGVGASNVGIVTGTKLSGSTPTEADNSRSSTKTPDTNAMPMDQLKQMLSAQLDYYFSR